MGYDFLPWDHDQQYLLPPDIRGWLPADHEVWALLKAASLLDFTDFFARRRGDGLGAGGLSPSDDNVAALRVRPGGTLVTHDRATLPRGSRLSGAVRQPDAGSCHHRKVPHQP